jgi:hypothetical protein
VNLGANQVLNELRDQNFGVRKIDDPHRDGGAAMPRSGDDLETVLRERANQERRKHPLRANAGGILCR